VAQPRKDKTMKNQVAVSAIRIAASGVEKERERLWMAERHKTPEPELVELRANVDDAIEHLTALIEQAHQHGL
jgi:hypothetical protein